SEASTASALLTQLLRALPATDTVSFQEPFRGPDGYLRMVYWAPIAIDPARDRRPGAWIGATIRADTSLSLMIREFPADYETGTFTVWRADGDSVRVVSDVSTTA